MDWVTLLYKIRDMKKTSKNTTKTVKTAKNATVNYTVHPLAHFTPVPENSRESINWAAKAYRDREISFYASASYEASSAPVVTKMTKKAKKALIAQGVEKAKQVRHFRPQLQVSQSSFVMVGGVPHKMKDGVLVPMTPAKDSKKWDVVNA